ncbi:MAG: hypothetical protein DMF22_06400 [Verrucomicrobia bacterium]|nr:MAG: hypothetical protein DMF22_06400 [Verrucomicrobiota bacterium]
MVNRLEFRVYAVSGARASRPPEGGTPNENDVLQSKLRIVLPCEIRKAAAYLWNVEPQTSCRGTNLR